MVWIGFETRNKVMCEEKMLKEKKSVDVGWKLAMRVTKPRQSADNQSMNGME